MQVKENHVEYHKFKRYAALVRVKSKSSHVAPWQPLVAFRNKERKNIHYYKAENQIADTNAHRHLDIFEVKNC